MAIFEVSDYNNSDYNSNDYFNSTGFNSTGYNWTDYNSTDYNATGSDYNATYSSVDSPPPFKPFRRDLASSLVIMIEPSDYPPGPFNSSDYVPGPFNDTNAWSNLTNLTAYNATLINLTGGIQNISYSLDSVGSALSSAFDPLVSFLQQIFSQINKKPGRSLVAASDFSTSLKTIKPNQKAEQTWSEAAAHYQDLLNDFSPSNDLVIDDRYSSYYDGDWTDLDVDQYSSSYNEYLYDLGKDDYDYGYFSSEGRFWFSRTDKARKAA